MKGYFSSYQFKKIQTKITTQKNLIVMGNFSSRKRLNRLGYTKEVDDEDLRLLKTSSKSRRASCAPLIQRSSSCAASWRTSASVFDDFSPHYAPGRIVRALYDYKPIFQNDLRFEEGDRLAVLQTLPNQIKAINLKNNAKGFVINKYFQPELTDEEINADWFFDNISRERAQKLLLSSSNSVGSFLIRPSEPLENGYPSRYTLDVKDWDETNQKFQVKYYRIWPMEKEFGFFMMVPYPFKTLTELVNFHSNYTNGICYPLTTTCKVPKKMTKRRQTICGNNKVIQLDDPAAEIRITVKNY